MTTTEGARMDTEGAPEIGPWVDDPDESCRVKLYADGNPAALVWHRAAAPAGREWRWLARPPGVHAEVEDAGRCDTAPTRDEAERQADAALDEIARGGE